MRSTMLAVLAGSTLLTGCVVRPAVIRPVGAVAVVRPAAPCPGGFFQPGYRGRWGRWHPGHWRCPGGRLVFVP
jgi:hypothetical protein